MAEATRVRVRTAIEELGFVRNETARRLRQGHSRTLGVVVEDVANPYFTDVAKGAEAAMNTDGFDALLCTSDGLAGKEQRCLEFLEEQRVSGVLITPVDLRPDRIARLRARGIAVVLLDRRDSTADACSARVDHAAGGEIAMNHLLGLGHRKLALVTAEAEPEPCRERRTGAEMAIAEATDGTAHDHQHMVLTPDLVIRESA